MPVLFFKKYKPLFRLFYRRKYLWSKRRAFKVFLKELIGFNPRNLELYETAFTHKSYRAEGCLLSYERLEFLGDAILSSVVADYLFHKMPKAGEGDLTRVRSRIVCRACLNELGRQYGVLEFLRHNMADRQLRGDIHGNVFEALIGAICRDRDYDTAKRFIHRRVLVRFPDLKVLDEEVVDFKSALIEYCQKHKLDYGFDTFGIGKGMFMSHLRVQNNTFEGKGMSKKLAEMEVSKIAYLKMCR